MKKKKVLMRSEDEKDSFQDLCGMRGTERKAEHGAGSKDGGKRDLPG